MYEIPSPPKFRRPPEDEYDDKKGTHRRPPLPGSSISRIFYKSGPLGPTWRHGYGREKTNALTRDIVWTFQHDMDNRIQLNLSELTVYSLFLIMITIIAFSKFHVSENFQLHQALRRQFVDRKFTSSLNNLISFNEVISVINMFEWMLYSLLPGILESEVWYRDKKHVIPTSVDNRNILYENILIGAIRLNWIRTTSDNCTVTAPFRAILNVCYPPYDSDFEDKQRFIGIRGNYWLWRWYSTKTIEGRLGSYRLQGYFHDIRSMDREPVIELLTKLMVNGVCQRGTRIFFLHFYVANANLNLFGYLLFYFELSPIGNVYPHYVIQTTRLLDYNTPWDYAVFGMEMSLLLYIGYFVFEEMLEFSFFNIKYPLYFWNYVDLFLIIGLCYVVYYPLMKTDEVYNTLKDLLQESKKKSIFEKELISIFDAKLRYKFILALVTFLAWVKLFKYFNFTLVMNQFDLTFSFAASKLLCLLCIFVILHLAFTMLTVLWFGVYMESYSTFGRAFFSLIRMVTGDSKLKEIRNAAGAFGLIIVIAYEFLFYLVLLGFVVAILLESYELITTVQAMKKDPLTTAKYLKRAYYNGCMRGEERVIKDRFKYRKRITYAEIRDLLHYANFTNLEIDMFCAKFGIMKEISVLDGEYLAYIVNNLETCRYRAHVPPDILMLTVLEEDAEMKRFLKGRHGLVTTETSKYPGLTDEYLEEIQRRLDEVEISIEKGASSVYGCYKIMRRGTKEGWIQKR